MQQPEDYLSLLRFWRQKLKDSGFNDIENENGVLKDSKFGYRIYEDTDSMYVTAKSQYFYLAAEFLNDHKFDNEIDKKVWELHCEGATCQEITKITNQHRTTANRMILKFKRIMLGTLKIKNE